MTRPAVYCGQVCCSTNFDILMRKCSSTEDGDVRRFRKPERETVRLSLLIFRAFEFGGRILYPPPFASRLCAKPRSLDTAFERAGGPWVTPLSRGRERLTHAAHDGVPAGAPSCRARASWWQRFAAHADRRGAAQARRVAYQECESTGDTSNLTG